MPDLTITSEPDAPQDEVRAIADGLGAFNDGVIGDAGYSPVRLFLRDGDGEIVGGLLAEIYLGWMYVRILWIADAHRGQGYGAALMRRAEDEARSRGCRAVWLDTFTFQAPGLYAKLGYREFGRLDDYPPGHARHFFMKSLVTGPAPDAGSR